jgi:transposase
LDVHQATVVACLRIVLPNGKIRKQMRTFGTTTRELLSLRQWLLSEGCTHVAMESTGVLLETGLCDFGRRVGDRHCQRAAR